MLKFGGRFDGENQSLVMYVVPVDNKWFVYLSKQEINVELQFWEWWILNLIGQNIPVDEVSNSYWVLHIYLYIYCKN